MALFSLSSALLSPYHGSVAELKEPSALKILYPYQFPSLGRFRRGGIALPAFGGLGWRSVAEQTIESVHLHSHRCFSFPEKDSNSTTELQGPEFALEDECTDGAMSSGRKMIMLFLSKSVIIGVLAFTMAAVAAASRNRRTGLVAEPADSGQVYVLNGKPVVSISNKFNEAEPRISSREKLSRSLCFASTALTANDGLTKLQEKAIDEAMQKFKEWVKDVRSDAQSQGVSEEVLDWALENIELSKESLVHTESMPEVKLTLDDYLKSYGSYMGNWDIIQSLATMSFTEKPASRSNYFRGELIEALLMLQKGTADRGRGPEGKTRLRGSWAGAMGQCQFMPTSFRDYALDYDGDGHKDIWESKADVFASIANYFKEHGWKEGGPIFQKVQVPRKLDESLVGLGVVKSVLDWEHKHGVHLNPGKAPPLPPDEMASLLMPNGPKGNAYLVCSNFRVILRYNSSSLYGFSVCELARLIEERSSNPYPTPAL
uniref:Transglycosylase SLT domain-containing protein n=1 Tax=Physcomitrium patens TaxID=3218 RepID=A0A7I4E694_PHYPA|nr:uncharacterized protein LOC112284287 isoform X3 [Physcomitrium patens]|eukprot:XP_024379744.1 uncharacterized protein LOC112284287 isoform X3 [Physcomitrella patens]